MNQKGFAPLVIIAAIALVVVAGGFGFVIYREVQETKEIEARTKAFEESSETQKTSELQEEATSEAEKAVAASVVNCGANAACFENNLKECTKAVLAVNLLGPEVQYRYEIVGGEGSSCQVKEGYDKIPDPELQNKYMTCHYTGVEEFDSSGSFSFSTDSESSIAFLRSLRDRECTGALYTHWVTTFSHISSTEECTLRTYSPSMSVAVGVIPEIEAEGFKGAASEVSWRSSDSSVAELSALTGASVKVTPLKSGTTLITIRDNVVGPECTISVSFEVW